MKANIEKMTLLNNNYRKILHTTKNMQLVLMSINPGDDIGVEIHKKTSQFIRVEEGKCVAIIGTKRYYLKDNDFVIIPPGKKHNIINSGNIPLKLYSIYTPPEHSKKLVQKYKK